jgi:hypothetical protein
VSVPVAATTLVRDGLSDVADAGVWHHRAAGGREAKLELCARTTALADLPWMAVPAGEAWGSRDREAFDGWPRLVDLFPLQHSGAQWKRTWPVGETRDVLVDRWQALLAAEDRREAFHESEAWTVERAGADLFDAGVTLPPLRSLSPTAPVPAIVRYGWRALDRQWCLADGRLGDRLRPLLWRIHGERQIYLTTLVSTGLSRGPAAIACAHVPDLHHFRGSFGDRGVFPLWRDPAATEPNVTEGLVAELGRRLGAALTPEDLFAYVYGCLAHPAYTELLAEALAEPGPRVPVTASPELFVKMIGLGRELLRLHTFGERMSDGRPIRGDARCLVAVPGDSYPEGFAYAGDTLRVGGGGFAPVSRAVWEYEVSGFKVVRAWLGFRMRRPRGRRSSPLDDVRPRRWTDDMTAELLELLWVLERSLVVHREQAALFGEIVAGPVIAREVMPRPRAGQERPPSVRGPRAGGAAGRTRTR